LSVANEPENGFARFCQRASDWSSSYSQESRSPPHARTPPLRLTLSMFGPVCPDRHMRSRPMHCPVLVRDEPARRLISCPAPQNSGGRTMTVAIAFVFIPIAKLFMRLKRAVETEL